jgi:hypothetical protein
MIVVKVGVKTECKINDLTDFGSRSTADCSRVQPKYVGGGW